MSSTFCKRETFDVSHVVETDSFYFKRTLEVVFGELKDKPQCFFYARESDSDGLIATYSDLNSAIYRAQYFHALIQDPYDHECWGNVVQRLCSERDQENNKSL